MTFDPLLVLMPALIAMRLAAMLVLTPIFTAFPLPMSYRLVLLLTLAAALAGVLPQGVAPAEPFSMGLLLRLAVSELMLGVLMAIGIFTAFSAFSFAGRLLDIQIGFGIAQVYDPVSRTQIPILTSIFNHAAIVLFFLLDGHQAVLRAFAYIMQRIPPGAFDITMVDAGRLIALTGKMFTLGFLLVAPVVFCVFVVEAGLAVLARGMPQMNMFVISLPVKIVTGLAALSFWARQMPAGMNRIYALMFDIWGGVLR